MTSTVIKNSGVVGPFLEWVERSSLTKQIWIWFHTKISWTELILVSPITNHNVEKYH